MFEKKYHLTGDGTVGVGVQDTGAGPGDIAFLGFVGGSGDQDNVSFDALSVDIKWDFHHCALDAFPGHQREVDGVHFDTVLVEHLGGRDDFVNQKIASI